MSLRKTVREFLTSLKEKLGLGALEKDPQEPPDLRESKGFSEYTLTLGFPTISIARRLPSWDKEMPDGFVPSAIELARLASLEKKINGIIKEIHTHTESNQTTITELKLHFERIDHIERRLDDMVDIKEEYLSVENNLRELAAFYDLISARFNPFIELNNEEIKPTKHEEGNSGNGKKESPGIILLEWMEFLLQRIPLEGIPKLLDFYQEMGWIDNGLKAKVNTCLSGLKLDEKGVTQNVDWRLTQEDQAKSLKFIREITGEEA